MAPPAACNRGRHLVVRDDLQIRPSSAVFWEHLRSAESMPVDPQNFNPQLVDRPAELAAGERTPHHS